MDEEERLKRHREARGKKKVTLQDLAREDPTNDDLKNYLNYMREESDRGSAVMAAALVERALEDAVRSHFVHPADGTAEKWFVGINAPFRTFAAKISLGRALAIYGPEMEGRLSLIKNIRNAFAHRMIPLDFSHPAVAAACHEVAESIDWKDKYDAKAIYATMCAQVAKSLGTYAQERGGMRVKPRFP